MLLDNSITVKVIAYDVQCVCTLYRLYDSNLETLNRNRPVILRLYTYLVVLYNDLLKLDSECNIFNKDEVEALHQIIEYIDELTSVQDFDTRDQLTEAILYFIHSELLPCEHQLDVMIEGYNTFSVARQSINKGKLRVIT